MPKQLRNCVFTVNNYTDKKENDIKKLAVAYCSYMVYGKEVGESGTPHLQGYLELDKRMAFNKLRKLIGGHIEARRGTQEQAITYCLKDVKVDNPAWTFGEKKCQGLRTDIGELKEDIASGEFTTQELMEKHEPAWKYGRAMSKYQALIDKQNTKAFRNVKVHVIWGKTGTGKSRYCREQDPDLYAVPVPNGGNLWFDGYDGEKTLLLDDFYGWIKYGQLLRLLDGYQQLLPVKGGFTYAKWTTIYITSNSEPDRWYERGLTPALKRRLSSVTEKLAINSQKFGVIIAQTCDSKNELCPAGGLPLKGAPKSLPAGTMMDTSDDESEVM